MILWPVCEPCAEEHDFKREPVHVRQITCRMCEQRVERYVIGVLSSNHVAVQQVAAALEKVGK